MTPAELPAYLREIRARVEAAAIPVCDAIAETYKEHLVGFTLHESGSSHPPVLGQPFAGTPAAPGRPPAFMPAGIHGSLSGSVTKTPASGSGGVAESVVAPHVIYAGVQEWGGVHTGHMWLWVAFIGPGDVRRRGWVRRTVTIPERPYMRTAVSETIANGALERAGMSAFEAAVWGV